ncbi:MAG: transcriptional repressor LexA [bacterium]|nr:transcriptional repressor LexA [bacterium]
MALTRRQREVLDVIREFVELHGYSPSLEEIGGRLGLSSVATVHKHVSHLVQKGFVRRAWNQNRSIELVGNDDHGGVAQLCLAGTIAAGQPLEAVQGTESITVPEDMVRNADRSYVLKVEGDSMINEQIRDGDFVVIEGRDQVSEGETVVALIEGSEATLKKFFREGPHVRLEPANPTIDPIVVPADRVQIQGVVVGVIRKY